MPFHEPKVIYSTPLPSNDDIRSTRHSNRASIKSRRYCTINLGLPPPYPPPPIPTMSCPSRSDIPTLVASTESTDSGLSTDEDDIIFPNPPPLTPLLRRMQSAPTLPQVNHAAVNALLNERSNSNLPDTSFPIPSTVEELVNWVNEQEKWVLSEAEPDVLSDFSWEALTPPTSATTEVPLFHNVPCPPPAPAKTLLCFTSPIAPVPSTSNPSIKDKRPSQNFTDSAAQHPDISNVQSPIPQRPRIIRKAASLHGTKFLTPNDSASRRCSFIPTMEYSPNEWPFHIPHRSVGCLDQLPSQRVQIPYRRERPLGVYGTVPLPEPRPLRKLTKKPGRPFTSTCSFMDMIEQPEPTKRQDKVKSMLVRAGWSIKKGWNKALVRKKSIIG